MIYRRVLLIVISLCTFTGFTEASDKDFFPLDEGRTWEYDIVVEGQAESSRKVIFTTLSPKVTEKGKILARESRVKWLSNGKEETLYEYYKDDAKGLNLINAGKNWLDNPFPTVARPNYIIYYPIKVGSSSQWENDNASHTRMVESISETVIVPAGTFKDCVKINGNSVFKKHGLTLSATSWYARDVGLVKRIVTKQGIKEITQLLSYSYIEK